MGLSGAKVTLKMLRLMSLKEDSWWDVNYDSQEWVFFFKKKKLKEKAGKLKEKSMNKP